MQFQSLQHIEDMEWEKFWNPKLYVENSLGEPQETIWQTLLFNSRGEATVYERRRIKGCFLENLELDEFPFDTQVTTEVSLCPRCILLTTSLTVPPPCSRHRPIYVDCLGDKREHYNNCYNTI